MEKIREEEKDPTLFEDIERLNSVVADVGRQHEVAEEHFTKQQLRRFVEEEALIGKDDST